MCGEKLFRFISLFEQLNSKSQRERASVRRCNNTAANNGNENRHKMFCKLRCLGSRQRLHRRHRIFTAAKRALFSPPVISHKRYINILVFYHNYLPRSLVVKCAASTANGKCVCFAEMHHTHRLSESENKRHT